MLPIVAKLDPNIASKELLLLEDFNKETDLSEDNKFNISALKQVRICLQPLKDVMLMCLFDCFYVLFRMIELICCKR